MPPALFHGGTVRQPFEAIAVERTAAREGIGGKVVGQQHMSHFRVQQSVNQPAIDHDSAADAGADCYVDCRVAILQRAPAPLCKRRCVYVEVESDGDVERSLQRGDEVRAGPSRFGGRHDLPIGGRTGSRIDRSERCHADRMQAAPTFVPAL